MDDLTGGARRGPLLALLEGQGGTGRDREGQEGTPDCGQIAVKTRVGLRAPYVSMRE
jgi:hypothetical protein